MNINFISRVYRINLEVNNQYLCFTLPYNVKKLKNGNCINYPKLESIEVEKNITNKKRKGGSSTNYPRSEYIVVQKNINKVVVVISVNFTLSC